MATKIRVQFDLLEYKHDGLCYFEQIPFSGVAYDLFPNGQLSSEVEHIDGLQEGMARSWFPSGQLECQQMFWRDASHGKYFEWFENGKLKMARLDQFGFAILTKEWNVDGELVKCKRLRRSDPGYDIWKLRRVQTQSWARL